VSGAAALLMADFPGDSLAQTEQRLETYAQNGVISDAKAGSPNKFLHVPDYTPGGTLPPPTTTPPPPPITGDSQCSFEPSSTPYCGVWENAGGDAFDWTRASGGTPSFGTGPDQASDGSHYVFIETSSPRTQGDDAILQTRSSVQLGSSASLAFDYHMKGQDIATLKVLVDADVVFVKTGEQGTGWKKAQVSLGSYAGRSATLKFVGERGSSWQGDIAIDNVDLKTGGGGGPTNPPTTTMAPTTMPPPTNPPTTTMAPPPTTVPPATTMPPPTTMAPPPTTVPPATTMPPPTTMAPPGGSLEKKIADLQKKVDEILRIVRQL